MWWCSRLVSWLVGVMAWLRRRRSGGSQNAGVITFSLKCLSYAGAFVRARWLGIGGAVACRPFDADGLSDLDINFFQWSCDLILSFCSG